MLEESEKIETEKISVGKMGLRAGLVYGLVMVIYSLIINFAGLTMNPNMGYLVWLIIIGAIVWAHIEFKKNNGGFMEYSQGLGLGVVMVVIGGIISGIFSIIYMTFIDANLLKNMLTLAREQLEKQPSINDEQIEQIMKFYEWFFQPHWLFLMSLVSSAIFGLIVSAIISIFTQKTNPDPFGAN
ncbi:MAG: DUF4199 domain-containing protein [Microscillaceae bacterium]|jgi:hypothetical protein|nr:DUF4199 domain-containing protein [Microscillaceae bacterium]